MDSHETSENEITLVFFTDFVVYFFTCTTTFSRRNDL